MYFIKLPLVSITGIIWFYKHTCYTFIIYSQVPLGVLQHNENRIDEMSKIMDHVHTYVPSITHCNDLVLPNEDIFEDNRDRFHRILLGGDQLTVARARGSIAVRKDHDSSKQRFDGLLPIVEDWHAKQSLLKVFCL